MTTYHPQALDGFLLIVSSEGFILYSSDSISDYLGLRQVNKFAKFNFCVALFISGYVLVIVYIHIASLV